MLMDIKICRNALLLIVWLLLGGCRSSTDEPKHSIILGDYQLASLATPHSHETVQITIVNNFECSACAAFDAEVERLRGIYGSRIQINYYDIYPDSDMQPALINAIVAGQENASEVRRYLYNYKRNKPGEPLDLAILKNKYLVNVKKIYDPIIVAEVRSRHELASRITTATPAVIIANQFMVKPDLARIRYVVDNLLKPDKKPTP